MQSHGERLPSTLTEGIQRRQHAVYAPQAPLASASTSVSAVQDSADAFAATSHHLHRFVLEHTRLDEELEQLRDNMAAAALHPEADAQVTKLCDALLSEAEGHATVEALTLTPTFAAFAHHESVPPKLLGPGAQRDHLLRFIFKTPERRAKQRLQASLRAVDSSEAFVAAASLTKAVQATLATKYRPWLARSDHLPIRVVIACRASPLASAPLSALAPAPALALPTTPVPESVDSLELCAVFSHNLMERTDDGVTTYISALRAAHGRDDVRRSCLRSALLSPEASQLQLSELLHALEAEFGRQNTIAAALQEVDDRLLHGLRCACTERRWHLHTSEVASDEPENSSKCSARTAIISPYPFDSMEDVAVDFSWSSSRTRSRRFAAVTFPPSLDGPGRALRPLTVVSTHVMHVNTRDASRSDHNSHHVTEAFDAVARRFGGDSSGGAKFVLAVGDFNFELPPSDLQSAGPEEGSRELQNAGAGVLSRLQVKDSERGLFHPWITTRPTVPTQLGEPNAVDGAAMLRLAQSPGLERALTISATVISDGHGRRPSSNAGEF